MTPRERLNLSAELLAGSRWNAAIAYSLHILAAWAVNDMEAASGELEARLAAEQTEANWEQWFLDDTLDAASSRTQGE